ncbi:MAG: hypothetical protein AAFX01_13890 [Cyanobacteria bacterium J06638_28]
MLLHPTGGRFSSVLCLLLTSGCAWIPVPPDIQTQPSEPADPVVLPAKASPVPPAQAPQMTHNQAAQAEPENADSTTCQTSKPGQIVGFEVFYAATLKGEAAARLYISQAPGASPGKSYGLAGDAVEAMATALDNACQSWVWLKWPESDYRGWLPATAVDLNR